MSLERLSGSEQEINIKNISAETKDSQPELLFDPERDLGKEFWDTMQKIIRRYESNEQYLFVVDDLFFLSFISKEKSAAIVNLNELKENAIRQFKTLKVKIAGEEKTVRSSDWPLFIKTAADLKILYPELNKEDLDITVEDEQKILENWKKNVAAGLSAEEVIFLRLWNSSFLDKIFPSKDLFLGVNKANSNFELTEENYHWYIRNLAARRLTFLEDARLEVDKKALDYYENRMANLAKNLTASEVFYFYVATADEVKYGPNGLEIINHKKEEDFRPRQEQMPVERNY